jgi:hypothetical protein
MGAVDLAIPSSFDRISSSTGKGPVQTMVDRYQYKQSTLDSCIKMEYSIMMT